MGPQEGASLTRSRSAGSHDALRPLPEPARWRSADGRPVARRVVPLPFAPHLQGSEHGGALVPGDVCDELTTAPQKTHVPSGAAGSVLDVLSDARRNHRPQVDGGVLEQECADVLRAFFAVRRG